MPKITAPTVAEHRIAQRAALLAATEAIVAELGVGAVNARSVGERAGLARSSFYEYFASKDEVLAALAIRAFEEWAAEVDESVSAAAPGRPRLHAYVEATMRMTADGRHALATGLRQAELSPSSYETIMAMHETLAAPLRALLAELGVFDVATQGALVQGLINSGVQLIGHGASAPSVAASINAVLDHGVK